MLPKAMKILHKDVCTKRVVVYILVIVNWPEGAPSTMEQYTSQNNSSYTNSHKIMLSEAKMKTVLLPCRKYNRDALHL